MGATAAAAREQHRTRSRAHRTTRTKWPAFGGDPAFRRRGGASCRRTGGTTSEPASWISRVTLHAKGAEDDAITAGNSNMCMTDARPVQAPVPKLTGLPRQIGVRPPRIWRDLEGEKPRRHCSKHFLYLKVALHIWDVAI